MTVRSPYSVIEIIVCNSEWPYCEIHHTVQHTAPLQVYSMKEIKESLPGKAVERYYASFQGTTGVTD
jgi:hypothetical protein